MLRAAMPKTAVHKNGYARAHESEVGSAGQRAMKPKSAAEYENGRPQQDLELRVAALYPAHDLRAGESALADRPRTRTTHEATPGALKSVNRSSRKCAR